MTSKREPKQPKTNLMEKWELEFVEKFLREKRHTDFDFLCSEVSWICDNCYQEACEKEGTGLIGN